MEVNQNTKGLWAIVLCAILWSTSGLFIKIIDWNPLVIAGARSLIAALFILGLRLLDRRPAPAGKSRRLYVILAALSYSATMILFVIANKLTASANVILLQYIAPVWAALLGWAMINERPRPEHWGALGAVAVGLLLFFKDGLAQGSLLGDAVALLSGVTFAAYSVFMRLQKDGRPEDSILLSHILTTAVCLPFFFIAPPALSPLSIASILALGIAQIGIASLLFAYGIRRVSAVQAMLTAVVEPVLNPVWVFVVTAELPSSSALAGGTVILAAVVASSAISSISSRKDFPAPPIAKELKPRGNGKDGETQEVCNSTGIYHHDAADEEEESFKNIRPS